MIKARHHSLYIAFFNWYINLITKRNFKASRFIADSELDIRSKSVFAIVNHFSWWDGFFMLMLNKKILGKQFHILMLAEQLKRRMFLNRLGAIGISRHSKQVVDTLNYCNTILEKPNNILFFFPQGEILPQSTPEIKFQKGAYKIVERSKNNINLLFVVNLTEYFSNRKPTLFTFYKLIDPTSITKAEDLEYAYQQYLNECKNRLSPEL